MIDPNTIEYDSHLQPFYFVGGDIDGDTLMVESTAEGDVYITANDGMIDVVLVFSKKIAAQMGDLLTLLASDA
jgi:hypothetical protein